mgnify:CR=1 FL=1
MSDRDKDYDFSSLMSDKDYAYCVFQYGLDDTTVRGMNDADWMAFFGCTQADLPYYLIDEDRWDEVDDHISLVDFRADEDDEDFGIPVLESDQEEDLWDSVFSTSRWSTPATYKPATPLRGALATAKKPAKAKKVPHYFVIVR